MSEKIPPELKAKLNALRAEVREQVKNSPKPELYLTPSSAYFSVLPGLGTSYVYSRRKLKPLLTLSYGG